MLDLLLPVVVIALSSAVQGAVGFGMNLLAVPVLLLLDRSSLVPGPVLVAGLLLSLLVGGRELGAVDPRSGWALLGLVPGTACGVLLLAVVPASAVGVLLGLLVLVAVAVSALRWQPSPTRPALVGAGTASGFLATAAGIGGPPIALVYAGSGGTRLRSTLSVFFVAASVLAVGALALAGRFGTGDLRLSATLLPGVLVGFAASGPLRRLVDAGRARPAVLTVSAVAAVGAVVAGLLR